MRIVFSFILTLALLVGIAYANIITVGDNYYSGDYYTIQEAINNSAVADTIQVSGNHNESIEIAGHNHDYLVLQGQWYVFPTNSSYWTFGGLGPYIHDVNGVVIEGFTIHNNSGWGIDFNSPDDTLTIQHNIISSTGTSIIVSGGSGDSQGVLLIRNNIFKNVVNQCFQGGSCIITNNIFDDVHTPVILHDSTSIVQNNIFQYTLGGLYWGQWPFNMMTNQGTINYNDFWFVDNPLEGIESPAYPIMWADPLLTGSWWETYYFLSENSPCRDAGNPDPAYNDPDGSRNDIGPFGGHGGNWLGWTGFAQSVVGKEEVKQNVTNQLSSSPNPFNSAATISYTLPQVGIVKLTVYDINGRQIAQLVNGWRTAGTHEVSFDGSGLASGTYLARLSAEGYNSVQKMVLVK